LGRIFPLGAFLTESEFLSLYTKVTKMVSPAEKLENEVTQEELDTMDETLTQMDMLFKSRCVCMPGTSNVKIREIPSTKEEK
jgi:hypothetical protein